MEFISKVGTSSMTSIPTTPHLRGGEISMETDLPFIIISAVFATAAIVSVVCVIYVMKKRDKRRRKYLRKQEVVPNDYVTARELGIIYSQDVATEPPTNTENQENSGEIQTISAQVSSSSDISNLDIDWISESSTNQSETSPRNVNLQDTEYDSDWSIQQSPREITQLRRVLLNADSTFQQNLSMTSHSNDVSSQSPVSITSQTSNVLLRNNDSNIVTQQIQEEPIYCSIDELGLEIV